MALKIIKLPSMSRVAAGSKATLEIPIGPTYHQIFFVAAGTGLDVADIGRIDVNIDARTVQTFKNLQRLFDLNSYYNRAADAAALFALHFFRGELLPAASAVPGGALGDMRKAPGIGTQGVSTFHIEMDIVAGAPADLTMQAYALVDPQPEPLGVFYKVREFPKNYSGSGEVEIADLPRGPWYGALHLFKSDITAAKVEANQVVIMEATKTVLERVQKEASPVKRVPVTGSATHIDFVTDGDIKNALQTAGLQDFRLKLTLGTAGAVDVIAETLDTLQGA